jgi:hypothetical protein
MSIIKNVAIVGGGTIGSSGESFLHRKVEPVSQRLIRPHIILHAKLAGAPLRKDHGNESNKHKRPGKEENRKVSL